MSWKRRLGGGGKRFLPGDEEGGEVGTVWVMIGVTAIFLGEVLNSFLGERQAGINGIGSIFVDKLFL